MQEVFSPNLYNLHINAVTLNFNDMLKSSLTYAIIIMDSYLIFRKEYEVRAWHKIQVKEN